MNRQNFIRRGDEMKNCEDLFEMKMMDKYFDRNIKFYDMKDRYDLIFNSEFDGESMRNGSVYSDLLIDLKEADKGKELHIWINSKGGDVDLLMLLSQHIETFEYVVTIGTGEIDSAGFMLWCLGDERYLGQKTFCMYHGLSSGNFGKANEMQEFGVFIEKYQCVFEAIVRDKGILTEEELKTGRYTEKWFLGKDLIDRGVSYDFVDYADRARAEYIDCCKIGGNIFIRDESGKYWEATLMTDGRTMKALMGEYLALLKDGKRDKLILELGSEFVEFVETWLSLKRKVLEGTGRISEENLLEDYEGMVGKGVEVKELRGKLEKWCASVNLGYKEKVVNKKRYIEIRLIK